MTLSDKVAVCLFAKAPQLGRVKTRMQPHLTEQESLALHCDLLDLCCSQLAALDRGAFQVELHVTEQHAFLDQLGKKYHLPIQLQNGANLGARMSHAVRQALQRYRNVILVGADCPSMNAREIERLRHALSHHQAVMVPALDGGYVALALKQHAPELFCNMPWGGDTVAAETLERLEALQWSFDCMPAQTDIDRPEDLKTLAGQLRQWAEKSL
ncbi:hypothetical protein FHR99_001127 [Litorivivens lipolytica]|uniref:Glycosyltransferase n=1 Tax=Litorivivens lipolytica TaxID=1524264 RepID=A0A7W4Z6G9_9GAMM|nr:TIGR04282 family arsenosugar biosynthesis glycosyltransferase [Litorivivens lipolytica]MBB3046891.1 hypothetical protein [Litorivivens lipolytica]